MRLKRDTQAPAARLAPRPTTWTLIVAGALSADPSLTVKANAA